MLADDDPRIVVLAMKILARVFFVEGRGMVEKVAEKHGGFVVMQYRLKRWWNIPAIWPICFAILFNSDIAQVNFNQPFQLFTLLETFSEKGQTKVVNAEMLPIIASLLKNGLKAIIKDQDYPQSPLEDKSNGTDRRDRGSRMRPKHNRKRSMSVGADLRLLGDHFT